MEPIIARGGGDVATGSIYKLCKAGYPVIILEVPRPSAIRRNVAFCQAVYDGFMTVEDMTCELRGSFREAYRDAIANIGRPYMIVDPTGECLKEYYPWLLVDGILAKKNMGTNRDMAAITIGLGPGFTAGEDVDYVIETQRGHTLGRIITHGPAMANTGIPGIIAGYGRERVIHSPADGIIRGVHKIADIVERGETIAVIRGEDGDVEVPASLDGILRGLIVDGYKVNKGLKIADIDPREAELSNCFTISDKARCIGGSVLEIAVAVEHGVLKKQKYF